MGWYLIWGHLDHTTMGGLLFLIESVAVKLGIQWAMKKPDHLLTTSTIKALQWIRRTTQPGCKLSCFWFLIVPVFSSAVCLVCCYSLSSYVLSIKVQNKLIYKHCIKSLQVIAPQPNITYLLMFLWCPLSSPLKSKKHSANSGLGTLSLQSSTAKSYWFCLWQWWFSTFGTSLKSQC